jgi:hypothetical protein
LWTEKFRGLTGGGRGDGWFTVGHYNLCYDVEGKAGCREGDKHHYIRMDGDIPYVNKELKKPGKILFHKSAKLGLV